jgi:hypothetical protein
MSGVRFQTCGSEDRVIGTEGWEVLVSVHGDFTSRVLGDLRLVPRWVE